MSEDIKWKYCVVGNIVKEHYDDNGVFRYGTPAFKGGARVYLCGKLWDETRETIPVLGLTRGRRYQVIDTSTRLIENVRCDRAFKPAVLSVMSDWEFYNDWWDDKAEDRAATKAFVARWNQRMLACANADDIE